MKAKIIKLNCQHLQNDGSRFYYAIMLSETGIGDNPFRDSLVLRAPEEHYATNEEMLPILQSIVDAINHIE